MGHRSDFQPPPPPPNEYYNVDPEEISRYVVFTVCQSTQYKWWLHKTQNGTNHRVDVTSDMLIFFKCSALYVSFSPIFNG